MGFEDKHVTFTCQFYKDYSTGNSVVLTLDKQSLPLLQSNNNNDIIIIIIIIIITIIIKNNNNNKSLFKKIEMKNVLLQLNGGTFKY